MLKDNWLGTMKGIVKGINFLFVGYLGPEEHYLAFYTDVRNSINKIPISNFKL